MTYFCNNLVNSLISIHSIRKQGGHQMVLGGESTKVYLMTTAVRVSSKLVSEAKKYSKIENRSVTAQIEYWAKIGKYAEENPELTYSLIKEMIRGIAELNSGDSSDYNFG